MRKLAISKLIAKPSKLAFFEEVFPQVFYEDDFIVRSDGNISAGVYLNLPSKERYDQNELDSLNKITTNLLAQLPTGTTVHKQDQFFFSNNLLKDVVVSEGFVSRHLRRHLGDRKILKQRTVLYVCFNLANRSAKNPASTFFSNYVGQFISPLKDLAAHKATASNALRALISGLAANGIKCRRMTTLELINEVYTYFNLTFTHQTTSFQNTMSNPVEGDFTVGNKKIKVSFLQSSGDRIHTVTRNNRGIVSFMAWPFGHHLPFEHLVNQAIRIDSTDEILAQIDRKVNLIMSQAGKRGLKQEQTIQVQELLDFTQQIRAESSKVVTLSHNVVHWNSSTDFLNAQSDLIQSAYSIMNESLALNDSFNGANYFHVFSPGMALDMFDGLRMPLHQANCFLDWTRSEVSESDGIVFCTRDGEPILVDLWSPQLSNKNLIILGPSGSGKTFTVLYIISQLIEQGVQMILLDVGGGYKNFCQLKKGTYYDYTPDAPLKSNPFLVSRDKDGGFKISEVEMVFLIAILTIMWKAKDALKPEEDAILQELIGLYYKEVNKINREAGGQVPKLNGFYDFVEKYFETLDRQSPVFEKYRYFDVNSFLLVLAKFVKNGKYASVFDVNETLVVSEEPLIVYDLAGIKEDPNLYALTGLIIMNVVGSKIKMNPAVRKLLLLDEAWSMFSSNLGPFIEYRYRTIRKTNGGIGIITQGITELKESEIGPVIVANSSMKILLDHASQTSLVPAIQGLLGLTNHEAELLLSIRNTPEFRDIFLKRENTAQLLTVDAGKVLGLGFSSWITDREPIQRYARDTGSMEYAIEQVVEDQNQGAI